MRRRGNITEQPNRVDTETIDNIAIKLVSTLDRNDLVHILLDMVEPRKMLENIVTTKKEQDRLADTVGSAYRKVVCFDCTEIHDKLLGILHHYNLKVGDIV